MTSAPREIPIWLPHLLDDNSFLKYHAYYKGIRHNHTEQGIIAMVKLGAPKASVQRLVHMAKSLIKERHDNEDDVLEEPLEFDYLKSNKLEDYRGKNQAFYKMLRMYTNLYKTKYNQDIVAMMKDVCSDIIDGPLFNSFHGIIQLAYGAAANCHHMMLEGITIMDQQYSPLYLDDPQNKKRTDLTMFGKGEKDLMEIFDELKDSPLVDKLKSENNKDGDERRERQMYGSYGWAAVKYHSDHFMDLANSIKLPEWFIPEQKDMEQLKRLIGWLMDVGTMVYVKNNIVNEFFVLHGITASWSALQVLPFLDFDTALLGFRSLVSGFLVMYVMQDAPGLDKEVEEYYDGTVTHEDWKKFIDETLEEDNIYEFHVYKVIQCLYERWQHNSDDREMSRYYFAAAKIVQSHIYSRGRRGRKFPNNDLSKLA